MQNLNNPVSNAFIMTYWQFRNICSLKLGIHSQDLYSNNWSIVTQNHLFLPFSSSSNPGTPIQAPPAA